MPASVLKREKLVPRADVAHKSQQLPFVVVLADAGKCWQVLEGSVEEPVLVGFAPRKVPQKRTASAKMASAHPASRWGRRIAPRAPPNQHRRFVGGLDGSLVYWMFGLATSIAGV